MRYYNPSTFSELMDGLNSLREGFYCRFIEDMPPAKMNWKQKEYGAKFNLGGLYFEFRKRCFEAYSLTQTPDWDSVYIGPIMPGQLPMVGHQIVHIRKGFTGSEEIIDWRIGWNDILKVIVKNGLLTASELYCAFRVDIGQKMLDLQDWRKQIVVTLPQASERTKQLVSMLSQRQLHRFMQIGGWKPSIIAGSPNHFPTELPDFKKLSLGQALCL